MTILQQDLVLLNEFLTVYNQEKSKLQAQVQHDSSDNEPASLREENSTASNALMVDGTSIDDDDSLIMEDIEEEVACRVANISKKSSESSYHKNLPGVLSL